MKAETQETVTISASELTKMMNTVDPVGEKLNNPVVIWLVAFVVVAFTGNMIYENINTGIAAANTKAEGALKLIDQVQDSVFETQNTQKTVVNALENISDTVKNISNQLFTIETTRFTDKDATVIKESFKADDIKMRQDINRIEVQVNSLYMMQSDIQILKGKVEQNSSLLKERGHFMGDLRERLKSLETERRK